MSDGAVQVLVGAGFAGVAAALAWRLRLRLAREIVVAALRAAAQLAAVGALIVVVFRYPSLSLVFVAAMAGAAAVTAGGRLGALPRARRLAGVAIAVPALGGCAALVATGAFAATPRAVVPTAGILLGGAMASATLTGRRFLEALRDDRAIVEARLALGDDVRTALAPTLRTAVVTGMVPAIDQTRTVGLVTLPGTFVGLVLGGASPETAARTQLVVLLALLLVELVAALLISAMISRAVTAPGQRVVALPGAVPGDRARPRRLPGFLRRARPSPGDS